MKNHTYITVLTIAGSDSGGGAGIQADGKTFAALGCYGTTAITAVTAQNTVGITAIHPVPPDIVLAQIRAVVEDIKPLAIKIGMVPSKAHARAILSALADYPGIPVVFDPVLAASTGASLAYWHDDPDLVKDLFARTSLLTPNLHEAEVLCGFGVRHPRDMAVAARHLLSAGANAVLIKGGHLPGDQVCDLYLDWQGLEILFEGRRIDSTNLHGTGCTLSSAIACYLARGETLRDAVASGRDYMRQAILAGRDVCTGKGSGPLNHFFDPQRLIKND